MNLREYLKTTNLITDGAFGTYFAAKYQTQDIPELANITAPEKVKKIHEEYLNAGAKFIRTNTFASNKETLQEDFADPRRYGSRNYDSAQNLYTVRSHYPDLSEPIQASHSL